MSNSKAVLAELLGSFVLLFGGGLAILASNGGLLAIAFGFGMALLAALYAFGERSGGHYNPAVSVAALLDKRIDTNTLIGYVAAQVFGFVLAALGLLLVFSQDEVALTTTQRSDPDRVGLAGAFFVEVILAAVFVAVILRVSKSEMYVRSAPLVIALTLVMIILAADPITGASVNPARSLASALIGNEWGDAVIWLFAPMVGGLVGWLLFRAVHEGESGPQAAQ